MCPLKAIIPVDPPSHSTNAKTPTSPLQNFAQFGDNAQASVQCAPCLIYSHIHCENQDTRSMLGWPYAAPQDIDTARLQSSVQASVDTNQIR